MTRLIATIPGLVGLLILGGWYFDVESIQRLGLASVAMNPMTAVCFILLSIALSVDGRVAEGRSPLAMGCYVLVLVIGAAKLAEVLFGWHLGVDTALFASKLDAIARPNRMAPNTALCFMLISCAALLVRQRWLAQCVSGQILAIFTAAVALFALVGYMYGVTAFYSVAAFIPMAAHTGICFLLISSAVLAMRSDRGIMAPISDAGFAGQSARVLLPAAMVIPLLLGWLRIAGERAGLYPSEIGVALMITATVLVLAGLTWLNSRSLMVVDRKRAAAEQALRTMNDELEARVRERTAAIAQQERFLAAILSNMQDAMIVSRDGHIVFANEAAARLIGGNAPADVVGRRTLDLVHPDARVSAAERAQQLRAGPAQLPVTEERLVRLDGKSIDVEVASASFAEGDKLAAISMVRDVTQRKLMERQLQHSSRMDAIGQLTGGIAHDFNNLLVVITGNLDLLESVLATNPKALGYAEMASKAAWRGAELTRQLLAFSRKQTLEPRVLDLNALVSETASLLRRTLGGQIELTVTLASDLWPALVDKTQFESALTNLAINARDAMPNGGKLIFETANKQLDASFTFQNEEVVPGDYVMIAVSDTGSGIPAEILSRVFEPFFTTKGEGKGTGLGLAMIYGFVKQSRGYVQIYSEVGYGTAVRLYLPRGEGAPGRIMETLADSLTAPRGTKVLVVEDNADVRRIAVSQLVEFGYDVIEAENGPAAIDILKSSQRVDLLFSDAIMPGGMTGMQLAEEATRMRHGLKVLLTSGFAEASLNAARATAGIPLISKPYRKQDLAKKVRDVLNETRV